MIQKLAFAAVMLVLAACGGTKSSTTASSSATPVSAPAAATVAVSPAGDWDYVITGTPEGDFKGVLKITPVAAAFSAKMVSAGSGGELVVDKFTFVKETSKVTGEVPYNGYTVAMDAVLAGDEMKGSMSAGGMDFPFNATRKK